MPKLPTTTRAIDGLRVAARADFFDAKTPGLMLRVTPSGVKSWSVSYRATGRRRRLTLGSYPTLGLADARDKARDELRRVQKEGADPAAERQAAKRAQPAPDRPFTFGDFVPVYVAFAKGKKSTWRDDVRKITRWLLPHWRDRPLRSLARADVHEVLDRASGAGLTTGVNRVQSVISRLFTVALDRGLVDAHPASRVLKRHPERPRDRVLTDDELRALWAGLDARPGRASDCLKLRLLLGQRVEEELMRMAWPEVDLEAGLWTIPRERTKNRKQPHTVPLPATALAILRRRRAEVPEGAPRVFPGLYGTSDEYRALSALKQGFEWLDLRRTLATRLAGLGFSETTIGRVLNHAKVTVTARHYNQHAYDAEKRQALDAWDRELQRILAGKPKTTKVRPFVRR